MGNTAMNPFDDVHDPAVLLAQSGWMQSLARSLVSDDAAEDLVQDAWLAMVKSPPRDFTAVRPWLARVLRNFAFRRRRAEHHLRARERRAARPEATTDASVEVLERAEMHRQVVEHVLRLKEPYRSTVLHRFFDDLSPPEIARRQNIPVTTVRSRIAKALADLRSSLDRANGGDRRAWGLAILPLTGWTRAQLAAPTTGEFSAAGNLTLGGLSVTAKKVTVAVLASVLLLLGLGTMHFVLREPSPGDRVAGNPVETAIQVVERGNSAAQPEATAAGTAEPAPVSPAPETPLAPPALEGKVTSTDGKPIPGARVLALDAEAWNAPINGVEERYSGPVTGIRALREVYGTLSAQAPSARTGDDGMYAFRGLRAGEYRVMVSHNDYLASPDSMAGVWEGATSRCDVQLAPGARLSGRVIDEAGKPIKDALVTCEPSRVAGARGMAKAVSILMAFSEGHTALEPNTTKSGDDGSFSLQSLELVPHDVRAHREGFVSTRLRDVAPGRGPVTVAMRRGASVSGLALAADGSPIRGAELELRELFAREGKNAMLMGMADFDFLGQKTRRGTTADDGRFRLEGVEQGSYELTARAAGFPRRALEVQVASDSVDLGEVRFEPGAAISGVVLGPGAAPLEKARVWARDTMPEKQGLREAEIEPSAETTSGAGGRFELSGLVPGSYEIRASAEPGLRGSLKNVETGKAMAVVQLDEGIVLSGVCLDVDGGPVKGATVTPQRSGEPQATSAADGTFTLRGIPRESVSKGFSLWSSHPEYRSTITSVGTEPPELVQVRFTALSGPRGVVIDEEGKPVARARVWAELPGMPMILVGMRPQSRTASWSGHTDENGVFRLQVSPPGKMEGTSIDVIASHERYGRGRVSVPFGGEVEWSEVEVVLSAGCVLQGRVTDAAGAPVATARVEARRLSASPIPDRFREIQALLPSAKGSVSHTAKDGSFQLSSLEAGSYQLDVTALGFARKTAEPVEVSKSSSPVDIELARGSSIGGRIVDEAGEPIAGAEVQAVRLPEGMKPISRGDILPMALGTGEANVSSAKSDANGRFRLTRLPDGQVLIAVRAAGFHPSIVESDGSSDAAADIVLLRNARLSGLAFDARTGERIPRYEVLVMGREPWTAEAVPPLDHLQKEVAAGDGSFVFEGLAPGTYEIQVSVPERLPFVQRIALEPGGEGRIEARIEAGERLEGLVKVRGGHTLVSGVHLELRRVTNKPLREEAGGSDKPRLAPSKGEVVRSDKDGGFVFPGLRAGEYTLHVHHPDFYLDEAGDSLTLSLPYGSAEPLEVQVKPAGKVSGRLDGKSQLDPKNDRLFFTVTRIEPADAAPTKDEEAAPSPEAVVSTGAVEADGSFLAGGLRPGRYRIDLRRGKDPRVLTSAEFEARDGEVTNVELP